MSQPDETASAAVIEAQDQFVLEWGRMSSSWGINRTMAQIHALLLITGRPHTMDEIIKRLHISRGNASMNLRDLTDWGIIHRTRKPGDRKDMYHAGDDVLQMFVRVVRERKRREIDPTVAAIRDCLAMVPPSEPSDEAGQLRHRLSSLLEVFGIVDRVYHEVFESDSSFKDALEMMRDDTKNPLDSRSGNDDESR